SSGGSGTPTSPSASACRSRSPPASTSKKSALMTKVQATHTCSQSSKLTWRRHPSSTRP
ncbi:unnamed protein product, partial [Phaeothamnion confervicola]